jgi:hypothetical protein
MKGKLRVGGFTGWRVYGLAVIIALVAIFTACDAYAAITVNGDLSDWGVTPGAYGASSWAPTNGAIYTVEDQQGGPTTYLTPGYGGQRYDAEAMYATREGGFAYLAIVTGFPDTGYGVHIPGDIAIDFGFTGTYSYGIKTYGANKGKMYKNLSSSSWANGLWSGVGDPTYIKSGLGDYVGDVDLDYIHSYYDTTGLDPSNDHYVIEVGIPESYFPSDWTTGGKIHWTMSCSNDAIDLNVPRTPEPATMSLLGLGLFGFLRFKKKKGACR